MRAAGADEVIDYIAAHVSGAIRTPVDVVLSLITAPDQQMAVLVDLIRPGGVIVTTAASAKADIARTVRSKSLFARSDVDQRAALVAKVDAGELRIDVTATFPLSDLAHVHHQGAAGKFRGKVLVPRNADART